MTQEPDWADREAASAIYDSSDWELSMDMRVAAALRRAKAEGQPKWQTMDTAPRDGTPLMLFARSKRATASCRVR